jgi:ATP-dependent Zn protease
LHEQSLGPLAYQQGARPMFLDQGMANGRRNLSEETAQAIDRESKTLSRPPTSRHWRPFATTAT